MRPHCALVYKSRGPIEIINLAMTNARKKAQTSRTVSAKSLANLKPPAKGEVRNPKGRPVGARGKATLAAEAHIAALAAAASAPTVDEKTPVHKMPLDFLMLTMNDPEQTTGFRFKCAVELMPYCHRRMPVAIDGGEGKPLMPASINPIDLLALTDEQLEKLLTRMEKLGA